MIKQPEAYIRIKQDTETAVQTYNDFMRQIAQVQDDAKKEILKVKTRTKDKIAKLKSDMTFFSKLIKGNNNLLKERGLEIVPFDAPKRGRKKAQEIARV